MKKVVVICLLLIPMVLAVSACAPEVGSKAWCQQMKETPKGDWSTNDAKAYAKHCLFE